MLFPSHPSISRRVPASSPLLRLGRFSLLAAFCALLLLCLTSDALAGTKNKDKKKKKSDEAGNSMGKDDRPAVIGANFNPYPSLAELLTSPTVRLYSWPADNPALVSFYRGGDGKRLLARLDGHDLTERALYLYLILNRAEHPDLFDLFQREKPGPARETLRGRLESAIRDWAADTALVPSPNALPMPSRQNSGEMDHLRLRAMLHPVYKLVWTDRFVAPRALVAREDLEKFHSENSDTFLPPHTAHVAMIFLPAPPDPSPERQTARARLDTIYNEILVANVAKTLDFGDLARRWSKHPSAASGGEIPEFTPGTHSREFESHAFGLTPGSFAQFETAEGCYLLQGLPTRPREPYPLEKVLPVIQRDLRLKFLRRLYVDQARSLTEDISPLTLIDMANFFRPSANPLRLGSLAITDDTLLDLFPGLMRSDLKVDREKLNRALSGVLTAEHIATDCEERAFDADPLFPDAYLLARTILYARESIDKKIAPSLILTRQQIQDYLLQNPAHFPALFRPRLSAVQARWGDPAEIGAANLAEIKSKMRGLMLEERDRYSSKTLEETIASQPPTQEDPFTLVSRLIQKSLILKTSSPNLVIQRWDDSMTTVTAAAAGTPAGTMNDIGLRLKPMRKNIDDQPRFPDLIETSTTLLMTVVEDPDYAAPPIAEMCAFELRQAVTADIETRLREEFLKEILAARKLEIYLP